MNLINQLEIKLKLEMLPLRELIFAQGTHFPFEKQYTDACDEPILIVHSSGTTGQLRMNYTWGTADTS